MNEENTNNKEMLDEIVQKMNEIGKTLNYEYSDNDTSPSSFPEPPDQHDQYVNLHVYDGAVYQVDKKSFDWDSAFEKLDQMNENIGAFMNIKKSIYAIETSGTMDDSVDEYVNAMISQLTEYLVGYGIDPGYSEKVEIPLTRLMMLVSDCLDITRVMINETMIHGISKTNSIFNGGGFVDTSNAMTYENAKDYSNIEFDDLPTYEDDEDEEVETTDTHTDRHVTPYRVEFSMSDGMKIKNVIKEPDDFKMDMAGVICFDDDINGRVDCLVGDDETPEEVMYKLFRTFIMADSNTESNVYDPGYTDKLLEEINTVIHEKIGDIISDEELEMLMNVPDYDPSKADIISDIEDHYFNETGEDLNVVVNNCVSEIMRKHNISPDSF